MVKKVLSYKSILKVAYPVILSGIAQNIINITDTIFLSKLGQAELGGAGNGGLFYFLFAVTGLGFATGSQIIIGRRNGEKNFSSIGGLFNSTLLIMFVFAVTIYCLLFFFSPKLFSVFVKHEDIYKSSLDYINYRSIGLLFTFPIYSFNAFFVGILRTKILTIGAFIMASINVFLDYALVFGEFGFPELGTRGAGLASSLSELSLLIIYIFYVAKYINLQKYQIHNKVFKLPFVKIKTNIKKITKVGMPIMLQHFFGVSSWFIFFLFIEKMGELPLAASHIIKSIYFILFIPIVGFSVSTNTIVSNLMGEKKADDVIKVMNKIILLGFIVLAILAPLIFFFRQQIIGFYTSDQELLEAALPVIEIILITSIFQNLGFVLHNGISGTGNTFVAMCIEFITISIYIICSYFAVFTYHFSLTFVWALEIVYFSLLTIFSFSYFQFFNWKKITI